jgi:hypothetical protein
MTLGHMFRWVRWTKTYRNFSNFSTIKKYPFLMNFTNVSKNKITKHVGKASTKNMF